MAQAVATVPPPPGGERGLLAAMAPLVQAAAHGAAAGGGSRQVVAAAVAVAIRTCAEVLAEGDSDDGEIDREVAVREELARPHLRLHVAAGRDGVQAQPSGACRAFRHWALHAGFGGGAAAAPATAVEAKRRVRGQRKRGRGGLERDPPPAGTQELEGSSRDSFSVDASEMPNVLSEKGEMKDIEGAPNCKATDELKERSLLKPVAKQMGEPTEKANEYAPDSKAEKVGVLVSDMSGGDVLGLEVGGTVDNRAEACTQDWFIGELSVEVGTQTVDQEVTGKGDKGKVESFFIGDVVRPRWGDAFADEVNEYGFLDGSDGVEIGSEGDSLGPLGFDSYAEDQPTVDSKGLSDTTSEHLGGISNEAENFVLSSEAGVAGEVKVEDFPEVGEAGFQQGVDGLRGGSEGVEAGSEVDAGVAAVSVGGSVDDQGACFPEAELDADRDLWRPGWRAADAAAAEPPRPAYDAAGRRWLHSSFGPGSPWSKWASKERKRLRRAQAGVLRAAA